MSTWLESCIHASKSAPRPPGLSWASRFLPQCFPSGLSPSGLSSYRGCREAVAEKEFPWHSSEWAPSLRYRERFSEELSGAGFMRTVFREPEAPPQSGGASRARDIGHCSQARRAEETYGPASERNRLWYRTVQARSGSSSSRAEIVFQAAFSLLNCPTMTRK